ncbi:DUF4270 family protein [Flavisolibacter sp. BT320]|nr:DUF4270 family protein [Flavisolibacter longurius]
MKLKVLAALLPFGFAFFLYSCTKLNEPTELGDELLPVVDNVNTFDTTLELQASYYPFNDSSRNLISENMALGKINDPVFGTTTADMYFNLSSRVYNASPFYNKDSVLGIDSVFLTLAYAGSYGDTASGSSRVNVDVAEILQDNGFNDTTLYRYDQSGFTTGPVLGTTTFTPSQFKDTITLIQKRDTTKLVNVLRIKLSNSLGQKLAQFDTTGNGGYKSDSLFRTLFRGLAVKTTDVSGPGVLSYFNPGNTVSSLTVYYRYTKDGVKDTSSAVFQHLTYSQANSIRRTAGGEYLANLAKTNSDQLYIQSAPQGSYVAISAPGLSTFPNKIIHRAELIAVKLPSAAENIFTVPNRLLLDHKGPTDTAFLFSQDIQIEASGSLNLSQFGGTLRNDNSYRFNITRYLQSIVTRNDRNDTLRLYAPLRSTLFAKTIGQYVSITNLSNIAAGRVVLAGVNHPNPASRLRLRIIYSNL